MYSKETCKALRAALQTALKSVETQFDGKIDLTKSFRFDQDTISFKFELQSNRSRRQVSTATSELFSILNLKKDEVYMKKNTYYTIVDFLPDRPKFSVQVKTQRGKTWLVEPSFLQTCTKIK